MLVLFSPLLGFLSVAQAEINVSQGDYSAYALVSERPNRVLSFTLSDLPAGAQLSSLTVRTVKDGLVRQAITPKDYSFGRNQLTITNDNGFLGNLAVGQYALDMTFSPWGSVAANFFVFATDTIMYLTEPATVLANIGDDVTFECQATATASFSYQWQRRSRTGWKNIRGATARIMTISSVPETLQGYTFRCVVSTSFASAASDEVKLYMIGAGDETPLWLYGLGCFLALGGLTGCFLWQRGKRTGLRKKTL